MRRTIPFICSFCLLISVKLWALNNPHFDHYTTENGLSHNEVRLIRQDSKGLMWFGTQNGLTSFDGYRFQIYKCDQDNRATICGDKIYSMTTSKNGGVWIGTTTGLCRINSEGQVERWSAICDRRKELESKFIHYLFVDSDDHLWIRDSWNGITVFDESSNQLDYILPDYKIESVFEDSNNVLWVCTTEGIIRYNKDEKKVENTFDIKINELYSDRYGILWGTGGAGIFYYSSSKRSFQQLQVPREFKDDYDKIGEDRYGQLYFGGYGSGLLVYNRDEDNFEWFEANPLDPGSTSSDDIYDIYSDRSGVVWLGTQEGLDIYDWTRNRFKSWRHIPNNEHSLSNNFIQAIFRDKQGILWLGTRDKGMDKVVETEAGFMFEHFPPQHSEPDGLWGNYVSSFLEDSKGRLWITTWDHGVNIYDRKNGTFKHLTSRADISGGLPSNSVQSVIQDKKERIWLGTQGGLVLVEEDDDGDFKLKTFAQDRYNSESLSINHIFKVFEDSKGRIWVATNHGGLNLMHEDTDGNIHFEHFRTNANDSTSISSDEVFVIFEDSKQQLWIGTSPAGLNKVIEDQENGESVFTFKAYTEKDGLSDNEVNAILEDETGNLWIGTNKGLSKFNPRTEVFVNYTTYDGVVKGKFRKNSAWRDEDGTMYFGGAGGVTYFNPIRMSENISVPHPGITNVLIDEQVILVGDSLNGNVIMAKGPLGLKIQLPYENNRFKVEFSAMLYTSPNRNIYSYRLAGYDDDWITYQGRNPMVNYTNLPKGLYTFQLRAANNDGVWSNDIEEMQVVVEAEKSFAMVWLAVIGVGVILVLGMRWQKRKKAEQIQSQEVKSSIDDRKSNISIPDELKDKVDELQELMTDEKLYLDSNLGLSDLADRLGMTPNQLSAMLNDHMGRNFYDLINEYRIEEVKRKLKDPKYQSQTILSIAWDCGFNSKSAFNRIFKNNTGMTPSAFQRKMNAEE
ncbi:helix-turn-helix domain-containing protein [Puteibacter caeruleilacunae]|nr:helix-turn-helix domain-containing protein [Puteibacter caeruleilacunae]